MGMNLKHVRNQKGVVTNQLVIIAVIVIAVILVLFFLLRDQGKDDEKNEPGLINPISLLA